METALIIPVHNRKSITLRCLRSLYSEPAPEYAVLVVDSGSTDGTTSAIAENFPDVILIEGTDRDWWAGATNMGVEYALDKGFKYIVTYNDDNIAGPDVIHSLVDSAREQPGAIVSAVVCDIHDQNRILFAGRKHSSMTDRYVYMDLEKNIEQLGSGLRDVDLLHGMATIFPAEVFRSTGLFDATAFPHLFADDDLVLRARDDGYRLLVDMNSVIYNDSKEKGLNPYSRRLGLMEIMKLLCSRKSVFQMSTRSRFLWRHRNNAASFIFTWVLDYTRLAGVILLRWFTTDNMYKKVEQRYMRFLARM